MPNSIKEHPLRGPIMFGRLESEARPTVNTATAAYWLNRSPQTLRVWAMTQRGPVIPRRIGGRLAWSVAEIRKLVSEVQS